MKDRPLLGIAVFLYIWLMVGFASGTGVLLGPARWVTAFTRAHGWGAGENVTMMLVIVLYVVGSFFASRWLAQRIDIGRTLARVGIPLGVTALAALSFYGWSDPAMLASFAGGEVGGQVGTARGANFLFGAYPDYQRLKELKEEGVTRVISLQSPEVIPIEPRGIAAERQAAKELGMDFINVPMLPWVSDNEEALQRLAAIADTARGRYYVHCGLGRDRANVARVFLEHHGLKVAASRELMAATTLAQRTEPFERGMPVQIERDVWLVPYPNRAEMFGYFLAGQFRSALSLLDESRPEQASLAAEARKLLPRYNVKVFFAPVPRSAPAGAASPAAALTAARIARGLPRPVAILVPGAAPKADSTVALAFRRAWAGAQLASAAPGRRTVADAGTR